MKLFEGAGWKNKIIELKEFVLKINFVSNRGMFLLLILFAIFNIRSVIYKNHAFDNKLQNNSIQTISNYASEKSIKKIVIDAGHGGKDPGCIGSGNIFEKTIALDLALKFGKLVEDSIKGVKVIYTRKTDKFIELFQRAALANANHADVFISIHCNSNPSIKNNGFESYIMGTHKTSANLLVSKRENESILLEKDYDKNSEYEGFDPNSPESDIIFSLYQNAFMDQSARLASSMHEAIKYNKVLNTKEVKQAGFLVLWKTAMPSILLESGFLSNASDLKLLNSEKGRKDLAYSMMIGFRNYRNWYSKQ